MQRFTFLRNPSPEELGESPEAFLQQHGGPVCLFVSGADSSRCRALVTLLHGNEPSGAKAVWRWARSGERPHTDIVCIIASVQAALIPPLFSHRQLPGQRDLNRCFQPPYDDRMGVLAEEVLELLQMHRPEAVVDMHNTSGKGPAFGVVSFEDRLHNALVSLFADQLIVTHLRLGALMETSDLQRPTVTVEVGGRNDLAADQIAFAGLRRYVNAENLFSMEPAPKTLEVFHNPVRLELQDDLSFCFADLPTACELTLRTDIEQYNHGITPAGSHLGWVDNPERAMFRALDMDGQCAAHKLVRLSGQDLITAQALRLFMATNNENIAKSDCLFYAVAADGSSVIA